jgi:antitoxin HicB
MSQRGTYTVSDGALVLTLEDAEEGGFIVTSPMEPELITQAESVAEAFEMARDAMEALAASRAKLIQQFQSLHSQSA